MQPLPLAAITPTPLQLPVLAPFVDTVALTN